MLMAGFSANTDLPPLLILPTPYRFQHRTAIWTLIG
jgi:hypothetical protein